MSEARSGLITRLVAAFALPDTAADLGDRAISPEELRALLVAAQVAPSADNAQIWRFITVTQTAPRALLAAAVAAPMRDAVANAPLLIVACGARFVVTRTRREQPFALIDVPIAVTHMLLKAAELGLACAWTLDPDEMVVRRALAIPEEVRVVALLALGRGTP